MVTHTEITNIIADIKCNDLKIHVVLNGDRLYIQISNGVWSGRKWMISYHMTPGEIVQTALMACLAWYEHETREAFHFRGRAIFNPHISLESLYSRAEDTEVRK